MNDGHVTIETLYLRYLIRRRDTYLDWHREVGNGKNVAYSSILADRVWRLPATSTWSVFCMIELKTGLE